MEYLSFDWFLQTLYYSQLVFNTTYRGYFRPLGFSLVVCLHVQILQKEKQQKNDILAIFQWHVPVNQALDFISCCMFFRRAECTNHPPPQESWKLFMWRLTRPPAYQGKESEECIRHRGWRLHPSAPPHPVQIREITDCEWIWKQLIICKYWLLAQPDVLRCLPHYF